MNTKYVFAAFLLIAMAFSCTPKVAETTATTETPAEVKDLSDTPDGNQSLCKNWNDSPRKSEIIENHVLYKDRLKEVRTEQKKGATASAEKIDGLYKEAFELWKVAYKMAPAADGKRADHFEDGIRFHNYFFTTAAAGSPAKKEAVDNIMRLYDERGGCYGEEGYIYGRKAFDYYYKYPDFADDQTKYDLFKKSIDTDGDKAQYFVLNPFTALLSNMTIEKKIPIEEARTYQQKIRNALAYGSKNCKTPKECEPWKVVEEYVPARLEQLEGLQGFYDCTYYKERYMAEFDADPTNCEVIDQTLGRLRWGGCDSGDADLAKVLQAKGVHCKAVVVEAGPLRKAKEALENARYKEAIGFYEEFINKTDDADKKARFTLRIAKIYYAHLKSFSKARQYARKAAKLKSGWGDPYLLIGRLYASSGPLCGPGRGWDSQVVTWPAIDMWNKAKSVDRNAAAEANKFIRRYQQYMPSVEDIFQRGLKAGSSYKVGCWIQTTTTIRPAK